MCTVVGKQRQIETRNTDDTKTDDCCQDRNGIILSQSCIFAIGFSSSSLMVLYIFRQTIIKYRVSFSEKENQNCAAEVYAFVEKNFLSKTDELKHDVTENNQGIYYCFFYQISSLVKVVTF